MQLSREKYQVRWVILLVAWLAAAWALYYQAAIVRDYLNIVSQLGLRGAAEANTPLKQPFPGFAADGQTWVRHAISLTEGNGLRLRYTTIDNAPDGREVHWNSLWAWTIAGAGWIHHLFNGTPLPISIERATLWLNPTVLMILIVVMSLMATIRAGVITGVIVTAAMTGSGRIYEGFFPSYVDHHGLLTVAVFGAMLGAIFMGGGWWLPSNKTDTPVLPPSPEIAENAARFSATFGAIGLWVSAASVIPPIALIGLSGLIAIVIQGRSAQQQGAKFEARVWRTWGRTGGGLSLAFYLLEYFPNHLGLRLEANHPFHALAWYGGGELIAYFGDWWLARGMEKSYRLPIGGVIVALVAVSISPVTILAFGSQVFTVIDPFLARLHSDYIQEFLPMWLTMRGLDSTTALQVVLVDNLPLIGGIATLTYFRRETPIVVWFATTAVLLFSAMAWWQSRWLLNASGIQVCLILVLFATLMTKRSALARWGVALVIIGALFAPTAISRITNGLADVNARRVSPRDANSALARDIASAIRASQPDGEITVLSSPNGSTGIGYYGRFKTLGTLYWENNEGLKKAAAIYAAHDEKEAADLIRAYHITHIALLSDENFVQQYYQLLHPNATEAQIKSCFGYKLFFERVVPQWLEMLPYRVPDDLAQLKTTVMLFKVNFKQNIAEALYNVAVSQITSGAIEEGNKTLELLIQKAPQIYQPWLRKGELLLARHDWEAAAEYSLKGISLAPEAERPALYISTAGSFYNQQQHALAIKIYRVSLQWRPSAEGACYLSWVLSTSHDDALRNPAESLTLAQDALKSDPNSPIFLNALAAALAENGRFPEAITAADRALQNAKLRGSSAAIIQTFAQRLAILKEGKPIRN